MTSEEIASADALLTANADLSRQIGEQNTTIGYQDAMLARLEAELTRLHERQFAAFTLIGRLDYFLETYAAQPDRIQRQLAAKLRREIADLTSTKASNDERQQ